MTDRLTQIAEKAFPGVPSSLTRDSWHLPWVRRILAAALDAAEDSPQLTDVWLRAACEQAREDTP